MPYRKLPKTDASRLKALKTILDKSETFTMGNRFLDWKTINHARQIYDKLLTASEQYKICAAAQSRGSSKDTKLHHKAVMYVSHFLQVLLLAIDRGEIKRSVLPMYGMEEGTRVLPNMKSKEGVLKFGKIIAEGEKTRIKQGGRPIYNPTIGMVSTHVDIFRQDYEQQKRLQERTEESLKPLRILRNEVDEVVLLLWNQVEERFNDLSKEEHMKACKEYGVVYYYRKQELKKMQERGETIPDYMR